VPSWAKGKNSIARPSIDKWWEVEKDPAIDGVMTYHDAILDSRSGKPRRIFIIRDSTRSGFHWGVGERNGLVRFRNVPVGSRVFLRFVGRRDTGNVIDGQRQTVIEFDARAETELPHPIPVADPRTSTGGRATPPGSDDDIPF
jgi:hypothetical protein